MNIESALDKYFLSLADFVRCVPTTTLSVTPGKGKDHFPSPTAYPEQNFKGGHDGLINQIFLGNYQWLNGDLSRIEETLIRITNTLENGSATTDRLLQGHRDVLCIRMFDDIAETFLK